MAGSWPKASRPKWRSMPALTRLVSGPAMAWSLSIHGAGNVRIDQDQKLTVRGARGRSQESGSSDQTNPYRRTAASSTVDAQPRRDRAPRSSRRLHLDRLGDELVLHRRRDRLQLQEQHVRGGRREVERGGRIDRARPRMGVPGDPGRRRPARSPLVPVTPSARPGSIITTSSAPLSIRPRNADGPALLAGAQRVVVPARSRASRRDRLGERVLEPVQPVRLEGGAMRMACSRSSPTRRRRRR